MNFAALFIVAVLGALPRAQAAPLTDEVIAKAHRIAIMPGTFDPVTTGHIAIAKLAIEKGGADMTILTAQENPKKKPIPRETRIDMLAAAAENLENVYYPARGSALYPIFRDQTLFGIVHRIRKINPKAEIDIVVGSDVASSLFTTFLFGISVRPKEWLVALRPGYEDETVSALLKFWKHTSMISEGTATSSTSVKQQLAEHPELYDNPVAGERQIHGLDPAVARLIFAKGTYKPLPSSRSCREIVVGA